MTRNHDRCKGFIDVLIFIAERHV